MTAETSSAVIGVDLGGTKCHAVLADAAGTILADLYRRSDEEPEPVDVLLGVLGDLRRTAADAGLRVDGVAIGIPAFLDPRTGLVVGGFNLGWHGFDLRAHLDAAGTGRYVVENDVNLAALGEARVGAGVGASSFVTVSLGTGLGGAVVVDGTLIRGAHGAAGEFGFLMSDRSQLRRPDFMGMETMVGGRNLAARARELAAADPASPLVDAPDTAAVFAAAAAGDPVGEQVVAELLDHVTMAIVDICAVLDPELVVFDGSIGRALVPHLPRLEELVGVTLLYPPRLCVSTLAPTAALAGAVAEARRLAGTADQSSRSSTSANS
jgi:glucokinase